MRRLSISTTAPRRLGALACALLLAGCAPKSDELSGHRLFAMGTWIEISAPPTEAAKLHSSVADVERMLRSFEKDYYAWGDGELAALNEALGTGGRFEASPQLEALLIDAQALAAASGGAFEPGVAPLVEAWGFHDATAVPLAPPQDDAIAAILDTFVGIGALEIADGQVSSPSGPARLDLGGIAKGRAVDRVLEILAARGVEHVLVNAGGDLRVRGHPPGRLWRIGIQSPRADQTLGTIGLDDGEAAFTSGDYERFFDTGTGRMHHLLDPATGFPATHTQAVTVIAADGTTADAAATALFIAGPARWPAMARALGIEHVLRVDASGSIELTPAMRDRIQISARYQSDIIVRSL